MVLKTLPQSIVSTLDTFTLLKIYQSSLNDSGALSTKARKELEEELVKRKVDLNVLNKVRR